MSAILNAKTFIEKCIAYAADRGFLDEAGRATTELADMKTRMDLLAKGATCELERAEALKEQVSKLREALTNLIEAMSPDDAGAWMVPNPERWESNRKFAHLLSDAKAALRDDEPEPADEDKDDMPPDVWMPDARTVVANNHDGTWTVTGMVKGQEGKRFAMLYEIEDTGVSAWFDRWLHPSRSERGGRRGTWNTNSDFYGE